MKPFIEEEKYCPICYEHLDYEDDYVNISHTKCGHIFHKKCLVQWYNLKPTCPLCRTDLYSDHNDKCDCECNAFPKCHTYKTMRVEKYECLMCHSEEHPSKLKKEFIRIVMKKECCVFVKTTQLLCESCIDDFELTDRDFIEMVCELRVKF